MITIIEIETGRVLYTTDGEFENTDSLVGVSELLTENFVNPHFNLETREYYEGATDEELAIYTGPDSVALWKLRFVLSQMSLEDSITDAINTLEEPQRTAANYIWNYGNDIDRHSSTVQFIQTALDLTEAQVNNIYTQASALTL